MHARLRAAIEQRRGVRERAPIPVQRLDPRTSPCPDRRTSARRRRRAEGSADRDARARRPSVRSRARRTASRRRGAGSPNPCAGSRSDSSGCATSGGSCSRAKSSERHDRSARVSPVAGQIALDVGGRVRARPVSPRGIIGIVEAREHPDQPRVVVPREAELARLGEARLPHAHRVLRVAARRIGEIRQQRCGMARRIPRRIVAQSVRRQRVPCRSAIVHRVPETAMREEVIVLALVPAPVAEQRARRGACVSPTRPSSARSTTRRRRRAACRPPTSAALFQTCRLESPSSYDAMSCDARLDERDRGRDRRASPIAPPASPTRADRARGRAEAARWTRDTC